MKTLHPLSTDTAFWESFDPIRGYPVPEEWQEELHGYLISGFPPGSFHTAVFANDLFTAAVRSHKLNTWDAISGLCLWIINLGPREAFGSAEKVEAWLKLTKDERVKILEDKGLLYTEEVVAWNLLKKDNS